MSKQHACLEDLGLFQEATLSITTVESLFYKPNSHWSKKHQQMTTNTNITEDNMVLMWQTFKDYDKLYSKDQNIVTRLESTEMGSRSALYVAEIGKTVCQ